MSYKLLLESRNHHVVVTSDGEQCLQTFFAHHAPNGTSSENPNQHSKSSKTTEFDLVILDYRMPKKDGLQVAQQILAMAPKQRIIIASAYSHELVELTASRAGYSVELLTKPFEFDMFLGLIEKDAIKPGSSSFRQSIGLERSTGALINQTGDVKEPTAVQNISDIFSFWR